MKNSLQDNPLYYVKGGKTTFIDDENVILSTKCILEENLIFDLNIFYSRDYGLDYEH